jgi:Ferritin-like domain
MTDDTQAARRAFLKTGAIAGAAAIAGSSAANAQIAASSNASLTRGDVAILSFLAAVETIEADLWLQYAELGGVQDSELPGLPTGGSAAYTAALNNLDGDMAQYIHDNTEDEFSHWFFLNAYLAAKGAAPVSLDRFRTLPSSKATGANQVGRLTNLMRLTVDTSWYTRYRSRTNNPDLDPGFKFPQAVPSLSSGQFPAIPRSDADLAPSGHIQAIANTAAFHFCFIEQGGSSLYPTLAQNVTSAEVLRVLLSIGPTETSHFQTWHDKAGNAVQPPLAPLADPSNPKLVFPNLNAPPFGGQDFQTNLIMPEPSPFLSRRLPAVSIIRPTSIANGGAVATIRAFTADGLFIGQPQEFFDFILKLARDADSARRGSVS